MATSDEKAASVVNSLFQTAPANRTKAQKLAEIGDERVEDMRKKAAQVKSSAAKAMPTNSGVERRRTTPDPKVPLASKSTNETFHMNDFPVLPPAWMKIQERTFALEDPEEEYNELEQDLRLNDALTPGNLQDALNKAEDNARRAHKLYIVARVEYERFDLETMPIIEAMRDAASRDIQGEKDRKERSKAITEADIKGRASVLFPDEWAIAMERKSKAEGMMDSLKSFAELWRQRCFSLSSMLNAGKRS